MYFVFCTSLCFYCISTKILVAYPPLQESLYMRVKHASVLQLGFFSFAFLFKIQSTGDQEKRRLSWLSCGDTRFLLPPRGLWLQYKERGFPSTTYLVFLSYLMKDPMITGNITHCHCWACPDTSERSFPSCVRAVVSRNTSQSGDDISNCLLLQQKVRGSPLLLLDDFCCFIIVCFF